MGPDELTRLAAESLYLVLLVSAPVLLASVVVGVLVGVFQAMTQVHEVTLGFVPKLVAVALVLVALGGWMGGHVLRFTQVLWRSIPHLGF